MTIWIRIALIMTSFFISGCQSELYKNLSENEVNQMLLILAQEGISSKKISNKKGSAYSISIDESYMPRAIAVLKNQGYPKDATRDCKRGDGIVVSPFEQRAFFICKLSQDIQITLTKIDSVFTARVHIVLPENDPFKTDFVPSSAAVFIKHHPDVNLQKIKMSIKLIVEKSIEGLSYDKVSVVMLPAMMTLDTSERDNQVVSGSSPYLYYLLIPLILLLGIFLWKNIRDKKNEQLQNLLANDEVA